MTSDLPNPADFGWSTFFDSQRDPDHDGLPVRVMAVHRDRIQVAGPGIDIAVAPFAQTAGDDESAATVGDWLLLDAATMRPRRLLKRKSLFKRRAAGTDRRLQLIAANVDTLFIVSSCNQDFNAARLERYLVLAKEADVMPLILLTKADLAESPETFARDAARLFAEPPGGDGGCARPGQRGLPGRLVRARADGGAGGLVRRRQVHLDQHADRLGPDRDAGHSRG